MQVRQDLQVKLDQGAILVLLATQVSLEHQELRVLQDSLVPLVLLVLLVLGVILVLQDKRVHLETLDLPDHQETLEGLDHLVREEM